MAQNGAPPVLKQRHPIHLPSDNSSTVLHDVDDDTPSHTEEKKPLLANKPLPTRHLLKAAPAWLYYIGFLTLLFAAAFQAHYALPAPVSELYNPTTGQAQFAESNVRRIVKHMSEQIGYRIVGTEQDLETQTYLLAEIKSLEKQAEMQALRGVDGLPKFETWVQVADGSHQFDFMSKGIRQEREHLIPFIRAHNFDQPCFFVSILPTCPPSSRLPSFFSSLLPLCGVHVLSVNAKR